VGNGSPRLLRQLVRRTALVALASLGFAPAAFADDGIVTVSVSAGPISASVSVAEPAGPAPAPAPPVNTPVTPVATPLPSVPQTVQATADARAAEPRIQVTITRPTHAIAAPTATTRHLSAKGFSPSQKPASRSTASLRRADSSRIGAPVRGPSRMAAQAVSPVLGSAPRIPDLPAPAPFGFGLMSSGATAVVTSLALLLALAAGFALLRAPPLGRRVSLLLAAPRPYVYLLQLERPD
jgi:hypothetical protein